MICRFRQTKFFRNVKDLNKFSLKKDFNENDKKNNVIKKSFLIEILCNYYF